MLFCFSTARRHGAHVSQGRPRPPQPVCRHGSRGHAHRVRGQARRGCRGACRCMTGQGSSRGTVAGDGRRIAPMPALQAIRLFTLCLSPLASVSATSLGPPVSPHLTPSFDPRSSSSPRRTPATGWTPTWRRAARSFCRPAPSTARSC